MSQPMLELDEVSSAIAKHIVSGNSGQVIIPGRIAVATLLRALPTWAQEHIRNTNSMDLRKIREQTEVLEAMEAAGKS